MQLYILTFEVFLHHKVLLLLLFYIDLIIQIYTTMCFLLHTHCMLSTEFWLKLRRVLYTIYLY